MASSRRRKEVETMISSLVQSSQHRKARSWSRVDTKVGDIHVKRWVPSSLRGNLQHLPKPTALMELNYRSKNNNGNQNNGNSTNPPRRSSRLKIRHVKPRYTEPSTDQDLSMTETSD